MLLEVVLVLGGVLGAVSGAGGVTAGQEVAQNSSLPLCYSSPQMKHKDLAGSWGVSTSPPLYWDLSCSTEWSKYSCIHQGFPIHARKAASYRFEPRDCHLLDFNAEDFMKKMSTKRIIFSGDSFIRQVLIAFSCLFEKHGMIAQKDVPWAPCNAKWPCHNAKHCIECGPHSGFFNFGFSLKGAQRSSQFQYVNEVNGGKSPGKVGSLKTGDMIFLGPGIFDTAQKATDKAWGHIVSHLKTNASVVWMHTWPAHFSTLDGEYNITELELQAIQGHGANASSIAAEGTSRCVDRTDFQRKEVESRSVHIKGHLLDGLIWLDGIEKLGSAKVGVGAGEFGDCQHFCLPGPPDEIARVIYTYLMASA